MISSTSRTSSVIGATILFLMGAFVVPSINAQPAVDDWAIVECVGIWHFDECSGTIANDASSYGNDGELRNSAQWTYDSHSGCAVAFSAATNSYVWVDDHPSLDFNDLEPGQGFMIDFWMKKEQTPSPNYAGLVCKHTQDGYGIRLGVDNRIGFEICRAGTPAEVIYSNTAMADNSWHHIVAVWDGATLYLYTDNMTTPDASKYVGDFAIGDASKWLDIGNDWPTDWENPFTGKIDEVQICVIREGPQWLRSDDSTDGCGYYPVDYYCSGYTWQTKLFPCYENFVVDSIGFYVYRYSQPTPATERLTFRVKLYEDDGVVHSDGCPDGEIDCAGPGVPVWQSGYLQTSTLPVDTSYWHTVDVPDYTMTGDFIVAVEILQSGYAPSLMTDCQDGIGCCTNFYYWCWRIGPHGPIFETREHYDFWSLEGLDPDTMGVNIIRAYGYNQGDPQPPILEITPHDIFFGHALIPRWVGGESITHTDVEFKNVGCGTDTVIEIYSTNPDFTWTGNDLPWYLDSGQSELIDITFQTMTEGLRYGGLAITHTGQDRTQDTVGLSGIGFNGHWLENFVPYPDPICSDWWVMQYECTCSIENPSWAIADSGWANQSAGHGRTWGGCLAEDMFLSSPFSNPDQEGIEVKWINHNDYNDDYYFHGLYWTSPNDPMFHYLAEITPTTQGEWEEIGPYYIRCHADSIQLGFYYVGEQADIWLIDDIMVDTLGPRPPIITHEHHTDDGPATFVHGQNCIRITAQVLDPNNDPVSVLLWYGDDATHNFVSTPMTPVTGCEYMNLYEGYICDLDTCHRYGYYFSADDGDPQTPTTYLPATAPTDHYHIDIMDNTMPQIAYDNGPVWYARYDPNYWETRFAVRYTPSSYPYYLGGAMVMVGSTFPDDDHEDIVVELHDDNGVDGSPGTLLRLPSLENGTSWNPATEMPDTICDDTSFASWVYIKIDPCVEIMDGDFYIAVRNRGGSVGTDQEAFGYDNGPQSVPYRTWIFYGDIGRWRPDSLGDPMGGSSTNLMLRAIECPCHLVVPTDVTVYKDPATSNKIVRWTNMGVPYYYVYRSTTDPYSGFTKVATTTDTFYVDTTPDKAFFHVTGSCYETVALPPEEPPTVDPSTMTAAGPVRRTPSGLRATLTVGEEWTLEKQLKAGIMPKKIKKMDAMRIRGSNEKFESRSE